MPNSLSGGRSIVEPDVVAVRLQLSIKLPLDFVNQGQHVSPLLVSSLPPVTDQTTRYHESMPRADREPISNDERGVVS